LSPSSYKVYVVETPIRVLAIPHGYSESANGVTVSPVFPKIEKGPALRKRGTLVLGTEQEPFIWKPSA
jgi:hypothetical protein